MRFFLVTINPLDILLWTIRRNEKDVMKLYDSLSPVMQISTGGTMLNFGYWTEKIHDPVLAQKNLCEFFGKLSELQTAQKAADIGSGLSARGKPKSWPTLTRRRPTNCSRPNTNKAPRPATTI